MNTFKEQAESLLNAAAGVRGIEAERSLTLRAIALALLAVVDQLVQVNFREDVRDGKAA